MWKENKFWIEDLLRILDQPSDTPILFRQACYTHPNVLQNKANPQPFTTLLLNTAQGWSSPCLMQYLCLHLYSQNEACFHSFLAKLRYVNHFIPLRGISYLGSFIWVWPFKICNRKIWTNRLLYWCVAILLPVDSPAYLLQPACMKLGLSKTLWAKNLVKIKTKLFEKTIFVHLLDDGF